MNLKRAQLKLASALCTIFLCTETLAFVVPHRLSLTDTAHRQQPASGLLALSAKKKRTGSKNKSSDAGRGFGKSSNSNVEKTYVFEPAADLYDDIDEEVAMKEFFQTYKDWHPLFTSIAQTPDVPASSHLDLSGSGSGSTRGDDLIFDDESPWVQLPQIPSGPEKDEQMAIVATVLDSFQKALTDIPVNEALYSKEDDENDLQFLEEGRRMLVLNRFQVMTSSSSTMLDQDALFRTCWSEIHHLVSEGGSGSGDSDSAADISMGNGSLVILSEFDDELGMDLNHFVNTKIRMPLNWLGLDDKFEIASFERGHNCIRLIHGLGDIPSLEERDREVEGFQ